MGKIISDPKTLAVRDCRLVLAPGVFDLLHRGHVELLAWAKSQGDRLLVGVNSDDSATRIKRRPIVPLADRLYVLAALAVVDYVVSFGEDTPLRLIQDVRPDVVVKGGDWRAEDVAGYGLADVRIFPRTNPVSTSGLIRACR